MRQAPEHPRSDHLDKARSDHAGPMLLIEPATAIVVDANAAGWRALGMDAAGAEPPVALDAAMPAVRRLREMATEFSQDCVWLETLVFWTPSGCVHLACELGMVADRTALILLHVLEHPAGRQPMAAAARNPPAMPASDDVGLQAKLGHELRTPLGAVVAYAEILKDEHFGPLASERYRDYARHIHESARHAMGVVDRMLGGETNVADPRQLTFADLDPACIVESCLAVARPLAEQAGLELSAEVPAGLPRVVADAISVRQMLLNLLTNAIKFARRGDQVHVRVTHEGDGPLTISVVDTGPGMDAMSQANAVAARRPTGHGRRAGLGLGLPLTRTLAEANGAALAIDSALGRGTCATISFGKDRLVLV